MKQQTLSRLMRMSWEIQRRRKSSRSRSLGAAWAIFLNEDITVYHLVKKHSHNHNVNMAQVQHLTLF
jgi:hypothetical protein